NSVNVSTVKTVVKAPEPTHLKVKSGESLSVIAKRYGSTAKQFQAYNNLSSSRLLEGQTLRIPSSNYIVPTRP
ncbi:LysM peptidoglycan-binding domain-containing protein, partial [Psychromonas arctica]